jgi:hypothetical protein
MERQGKSYPIWLGDTRQNKGALLEECPLCDLAEAEVSDGAASVTSEYSLEASCRGAGSLDHELIIEILLFEAGSLAA